MAFTENFDFWLFDTPRHGELNTGGFDFWFRDTPFVQPTPPFDVFQGWANDLLVQRESSLGGALTGLVHTVTAKTAFGYEPVQAPGIQRVNLWRCQDGSTTSGTWYRGSLELELNFGDALLAMLETIFDTTSVTPTGFGDNVHRLYPARVRARRSVKLQLSLENGKHQIWHGVVVDSVTVTAMARRLVKVRLEWKASAFDASLDSPTIDDSSASIQENERCTGLQFALRVDGGENRPDVTEFSLTYADPVEPTRFDDLGRPTIMTATGATAWGVEASVWWAKDDSFDLWAGLARGLTEARLYFSVTAIVAGKTKDLVLDTGRWVFRSGTPVPASKESVTFRLAASKQTADANPTNEELRITV